MSSELETEKALWKQYPRAAATEFAKVGARVAIILVFC